MENKVEKFVITSKQQKEWTAGEGAAFFLNGVVVIGLIFPLIASGLALFAGLGGPALLAPAGALQLIGVYFLIHSVLEAGIFSAIH